MMGSARGDYIWVSGCGLSVVRSVCEVGMSVFCAM